LASLIDSFSPVQTNESERTLIQLLPNSLDQLARLSAPDRADVRILLENITRGQTLDLVRFADATQPRALATDLELHEYTYLVAGCVGEFWTRVCFRHVPNFSDLPEVEMEELGKRYGVGLQLINILRDAYSDLQAGRCYFPLQELEEVGLTPSGILLEPGRFEFIFKKWREEAQRGLVTGMTYVHAIHNRRIRAATALPALIGTRTLSILQAAGPMELHRQLKVPRHEVRAMIAKLAVTLAAQRSLQTMFQRYSGH
jgi:farnesyl-diphosphate farnesyltransferase